LCGQVADAVSQLQFQDFPDGLPVVLHFLLDFLYVLCFCVGVPHPGSGRTQDAQDKQGEWFALHFINHPG